MYTSVSRSTGSKNGGETFGRFVKLFGNTHVAGSAIAEAFKIAKGFLPVIDEPPPYFDVDPSSPSRLPEDLAPAPYTCPDIPYTDLGPDFVDFPSFDMVLLLLVAEAEPV